MIAEDNKTTIGKVSVRVDAIAKELGEHKKATKNEMNLLHESIAALSTKIGATNSDGSGTYASIAAGGATAVAREGQGTGAGCETMGAGQYWRARRCARIAPVQGDTVQEMWANAQIFFAQMMKIPTAELREQDILEIRRVLAPRDKKTRNEVCVVFADAETRDRVAPYARNLGSFIQNGKPTATFRHEVPTHLSGVYKTLLQYGYTIFLH